MKTIRILLKERCHHDDNCPVEYETTIASLNTYDWGIDFITSNDPHTHKKRIPWSSIYEITEQIS